jgi:hypothetical protein
MNKLSKSICAVALLFGFVSPAIAVPPRGLEAGGRTLAGPGTVVVAKGASEVVLSNLWATDACVTVANVGVIDLTVATAGVGQHSVVVLPGDTYGLCEEAMVSASLSCTGAQAGTCRASWRVDR